MVLVVLARAAPAGAGKTVKLTAVFAVVVASVILQVTLARYTVGGRWVFDFVVAGVVFVGAAVGAGGRDSGRHARRAAAGRAGRRHRRRRRPGQDAGRLCGRASSARSSCSCARTPGRSSSSWPRSCTGCSRIGLSGLIEQHWPSVPWGAMLAETSINGLRRCSRFRRRTRCPARWRGGATAGARVSQAQVVGPDHADGRLRGTAVE